MKLSIIILSYNTKGLTLSCLKSIVSQYKLEIEKKEAEVIILDNNSSDDSVGSIKNYIVSIKYGEAIKLIQSKENVGFARGCNLGAKNAKGNYFLFLNSDTEVLDKGFFGMIEFLEKNSNAAILGGKLENNDGSVQRSCGKFYNLFNLLIMLLGFERLGFLRSSPDKIQKVDWVSGACMMVRGDMFEKLTGFDEKLFMYLEDMEICFRAGKLGFSTYFYPNLTLKHKSLGSSNRTFAIINIYRGILHFYTKHKTYLEYLIAKTLLITKAEILISVGFLTFNSELKDRYRKAIS
ncbi:MAG: glycosyltransferase family 2 protein [Candidatus Levybacteria bacterium]|nr:glycosyltransferase family 2 protein [Candidatus Levybacteria bacterium]